MSWLEAVGAVVTEAAFGGESSGRRADRWCVGLKQQLQLRVAAVVTELRDGVLA